MGIATAALVGAGAATIGSSLIAANQAKQGTKAAQNAAQQAAATIGAVNVPDIEQMKLVLDQYRQAGEYRPDLEQAIELAESAMENVETNPELAQQQLAMVQQMGEIAEGGLTEADQAAAREIQRKVAGSDMARRKAILNDMAQRGVLGSGMELAAQLQGAQDSLDQESAASDALTREAMARSLDALRSGSGMASQLRQQDFGEQSAVAQARDAINQFNVQNQQQLQARNVQNKNQAQMANLQAQQAIANANIDLANQQQMHNKNLLQQQFNNQMTKAGAMAGQQQAVGQAAQAGANQQAQIIAGAGGALGNMFGGIAGQAMKATPAKTNMGVYEPEVADALAQVNPRYGR